jgi:RNA polymerase sigma-70 factor, ECF subfamily
MDSGSPGQSLSQQVYRGPPDPATWVDEHGEVLYRYALVRVRRREVAEDLVQETLLAALNARDRFQKRSADRTWLIGILRHKLIDYLRSRSRGLPGAEQKSHSDWLDDLFDERGRWINQPDPDAVRPEQLLEQQEFWEIFDQCLDELAPRSREAFARRVLEQEDTQTVCKALSVTATNLWVILFRARTQMRRCLMSKWFQGEAPGLKANES